MILLQGYGDDCNGTPENRKLSQADKDALLDIHNNLRYSVGIFRNTTTMSQIKGRAGI